MIIEIKDIPQNRNIKKVTFDIEFEDGEPVSSSSGGSESYFSETGDRRDHNSQVETQETAKEPETPEVYSEHSAEIPNITTEGREKKEVPSEMQDIEF